MDVTRKAGLAAAILVLLGLGGDTLGLVRVGAPLWLSGPALALPVLPLLGAVWPRRAAGLATLSGVLALPLLVAAGLAGPGLPFLFLFLLGCLAAIWAQTGARLRRAALLIACAIGLWSLAGLGAALIQIRQLSAGAPWCVARQGKFTAGLSDLRAAALFTTATGFKDSSRWYFHGVLRTPDRVWIWSPRRLRFDPLPDPGRMTVDPRLACDPVPGRLVPPLF